MGHLAVLLSKPHITPHLPMMVRFVESALGSLRIRVVRTRKIAFTPERLQAHYLPHSLFAFTSSLEHRQHLLPETVFALEARGGGAIDELIRKRVYLSAYEAVREFAVTPRDLYQSWEAAKDEPATQVGYHFKQLEPRRGVSCLVANAYFPYRFTLMDQSAEEAQAWLLECPEDLSIAESRRTLLGDLGGDPASLRGHVSAAARRLQLHVDKFNNGFHLSDTLGAALREVALWFSDEVYLLMPSLRSWGIECSAERAAEFLMSQAYALRCSALQDSSSLRSAYEALYPSAAH